ncbi:cellulose synthase complex periplasmic endoglucanase BcsZ [Idiomarina sp.]|uniref:cellulose synthase complex periplasmic endoglucanase BcsZ n=1 Tax=Idiomarina sp. TaxID=1874361 RepID=UPI00258597D1|nr:cellulose synthase complex periplasmic endoglucanase BcsZ [Idiomarina sp.]
MQRFCKVFIFALSAVLLSGCDSAQQQTSEQWQPTKSTLQYRHHWQRFNEDFIDAQFRVIDRSSEALISTSEGQVYSMLFSLFANQPERFAKLLAWTENNLADGDLHSHLPAWQWGHDLSADTWTVLDTNSATDVDILLIYALYHAADVWQTPEYRETAEALTARLMREAVTYHRGELLLLPAPIGFSSSDSITVNPSYAPLFVLDGLFELSGDARWLALSQAQQRFMKTYNPSGVVADWLVISNSGEILNSDEAKGSYDAIRSYYWFALDPKQRLLEHYLTMAHQSQAQPQPPETLNWLTGAAEGDANIGFSAMLLPYFKKSAPLAYQRGLKRIETTPVSNYANNYYDHVLILFGLAYQQCFDVNPDGTLDLFWVKHQENKACHAN